MISLYQIKNIGIFLSLALSWWICSSFNGEMHKLCKKKNYKCWCENEPLKWSDFKGSPDYSKTYIAAVSVSFIYKTRYKKKDNILEVYLHALLERDKSYVKVQKRPNSYDLLHEQMHFNIQEIYTRMNRQKIKEVIFSDSVNTLLQVRKILNDIHWEYYYSAKNAQKTYDAETDHGNIVDKQMEWNSKIEKELKELEDYSNPKIILKLPNLVKE